MTNHLHQRLILSLTFLLIGCADPEKEALTPNNEPLPPGEWIETSPDPSPSARVLHAMVYDETNQQVILFGGRDKDGARDDTWVYKDNQWEQKSPQGSPPPRAGHAMVYDPVNKRVILFGGVDPTGSNVDNDTWVYDVGGDSWANLNLDPADSPSPHNLATMVYVPTTEQAILFGGETTTGLDNETWVFDNDTWTERTPNSSPPPRQKHAMAYDEINQQVILFGGETDSDEKNGETWAYDVNNNTWRELSPSNPPTARIGHTMVYDTINERIMMFGGFATGSSVPTGETWVFDYPTNQWSQLFPSSPGGHFFHAMVYDSDNQQAILFGGAWKGCGGSDCTVDPDFYTGDTWIYISDQ